MAGTAAPATTPQNALMSFFWGPNGQKLTPQQAAANQEVANAMILRQGAPKNVGEGLSAIGQALIAKDMRDRGMAAQSEGIDKATADFPGVMADPNKAVDFLANDAFATPGQQSIVQAVLAQKMKLADPMVQAQIAQLWGSANKDSVEAGLPPQGPYAGGAGGGNGYVGLPGSDTASAENRLLLDGDPASPAYAVAYEHQYGPKTISVPGIDGVPVIQTIQQPIPASIRKPSYAPAPPPPSAPAGAPTTAAPVVAPDAAAPSDATTINTVGGGSVTQQGSQVTKPVYAANRAMTVAAPALKSLHQVMGSLGDPQNRIALQSGDWGKFLASDDGKRALDSINAIANTVASAQNIDPKTVREELTPLSTDSPGMRQYRLERADQYVLGLASGGDTNAAQAAVKDAIATPSEATTTAGGPPKVQNDADYNALASGTKFLAPDGTIRVKP